jgi:hypothetical protein
MHLEAWYSRVFNVAARLTGACFLSGGILMAVVSATDRTGEWGIAMVGGVFGAVVGAALLLVRAYRPDLGDSWHSDPNATPRPRTWWTGESRSESPARDLRSRSE